MNVRVLFFGATANIVGLRELDLTVGGATTVRAVTDQLSWDHSTLSNHKLLVSVNEEYSDADTLLNDGDEIAIFTAVSGG